MKEPFKVGDRVAVYGPDSSGERHEFAGCMDGYRGTVTDVNPTVINGIKVRMDKYGSPTLYMHPKQCRRLRPKRKAREIWVNVYDDGKHLGYNCHEDALKGGTNTHGAYRGEGGKPRLFREVKP